MGAADPGPRIVVAGVSGSGKTTLVTRIAARLGIACFEMDALHHGPGWVPRGEFLDDVRRHVAESVWVTEYQYSAARPLLISRATLVVWLDLPTWRVMAQLSRRTIMRRVRRTVLWNGNVEPPLRTVLTDRDHVVRWAWRKRNQLRERLRDEAGSVPAVRLRSYAEAERWLESLHFPA